MQQVVSAKRGTDNLSLVLGKIQGSPRLAGKLLKDRTRFGQCFTHYNRHTTLHDTSLFDGYGGQRMAQKLGVVQTDVGDDRQYGADDVGTVEPAAQPYLYDGNIDRLVGKVFEGQGCCDFEEGGMQRFKEASLGLNEVYYIFLGNHLSVDADALAKVYQMGRGVKAHLEPFVLQHGGQRVCAAPFSVGACHMDGAVASVRMVEMAVEFQRSSEPFFICVSAHLLEERGGCIEVIYGFGVGHG